MAPNAIKGTYFSRNAYAGSFWRLAIIAIDSVVLLLFTILFFIAGSILRSVIEIPIQWLYIAWLFLCFFYLGPIHSIGLRTIGFKLTGFRLVDLSGHRPSVWQTLIRCGYLFLFPSYMLVDVVCSCSPITRRTMWDKGADTVVVQEKASPVGTGIMQYSLEFFFGMCLVSREPIIVEK